MPTMLHKLMHLLLCATAVSNLAVNALPAGGGGSTSDAPPALPMVEHPASKAYWGALKVPDTSPPRNWLPPKGKNEDWIFTYTEKAARRGYRDLRKKHHDGKDWRGLVVTLYVPDLGVYAATKASGSYIDEHKKDAPVWAKAAGGGGKHVDAADAVL